MRELQCAIHDIGRADLPVLLVGEKGTGKEIVAREIHRHHGGTGATFFHVRCSEHDPILLHQLFEKTTRLARQTSARSSTVFLDEIGDLSLPCQTALVEAIADGEGKTHIDRLEARLISSSSRNLEEEIRKQHFREDLFYRLNGVCLRVPPLRQRKEDIPSLLQMFLKRHAETLGCPAVTLQPETLEMLMQHAWPGNVRELEEVARKIVASDERTALAGLSVPIAETAGVREIAKVLSLKEAARNASRQVERELILKTLSRTRWNRKRAARELGISYKALLYKLKQIVFEDSTEL